MDELREKVIKGLRCHSEPHFGEDELFCESCPYDDATCGLDVPNDALKVIMAQEPVKPTLDKYTNYTCGDCGRMITRAHKFCPECGRAVKWE